MAMWRIEIGKEAEKELAALDKSVYARAVEKLEWLSKNFSSISPQLLRHYRVGEYKLRIGDYRILYKVKNADTIFVVEVGHRSQIYRKKKE